MARSEPTATEEWRAHWPMVASALAGMSFATIALSSMGLFMEPLTQEFGWTRAQVTYGLTIVSLFGVPLSPFIGALIDRWGSRRLAIPGVILAACAFASFSLAQGSVRQWMMLWVFYAMVAIAIKTTVWTAAVSSMFVASRGLALAVVLSGAAFSSTVTPLVAQWLIDDYGWRSAYRWLGLGWGGFVLVLVLLFFFDARDYERGRERRTAIGPMPSILSGLTLTEGLRNPALLRIAAALLLSTFLGVGITVHKVPILTESGITRQTAAQIAAAAGIAGLCGKLLTGWLLDRWRSSWIGGVCLTLPALACALLLEPLRNPVSIVAAMVIFGYSAGAYLHICTYLTTRYGGLRSFGKIFGLMASLMALGSGLGPVVVGMVYDRFGSYAPLLMAGIPIGILCGMLVIGLGAYPDWTTRAAVAPPQPND